MLSGAVNLSLLSLCLGSIFAVQQLKLGMKYITIVARGQLFYVRVKQMTTRNLQIKFNTIINNIILTGERTSGLNIFLSHMMKYEADPGMFLPVAVGHNQTLWLPTGILTLPAPHPLLARPAPPLAGRLLFIIIVPCQPEGVKRRKRESDDTETFFFFTFNF